MPKTASVGTGSCDENATGHCGRTSDTQDVIRQSQSIDGPAAPRDVKPLAWVCIVISILAGMFLFTLDNTIVANVQPAIIRSLGEVEKLPWISVAYALGAIAFNLLISSLFSKFNIKWLFVSGVVLFEVGSVLCGAAPTMNALIVGRVVCGLGGVGIYVGGMNLLSTMTTEAERPFYLSIIGLAWGFGTIFGPIIGGALASTSAGWRWCFYLNLFVGAVAAPIYLFLIPSSDPRPGVSKLVLFKELDWLGAILQAGALVTFTMAIAFAGGLYSWGSSQIIALLAVSGFLWISFVLQQYLTIATSPEHRLFPVKYLKTIEMDVLFAQVASGVTVVYLPLYFVPLYFQFVNGDSALKSGIHLLPLVVSQVVGTIFSGATLNKVGYYTGYYLAGGVLSLVGGALFHVVRLDTSTSAIYGYSILVGVGCGLYTQVGYPVAQLKVAAREIPSVVQFLGFGQITGITLTLLVANCIFLNLATDKIASVLPSVPRQTVQQAITGTGGDFLGSLDPSVRTPVLAAIVQSIDAVYVMVIAAGALTIVLTLFMKWERIGSKMDNDHLEKDSRGSENDVELS